MGTKSKSFSLLLVVTLAVLSLLTVEPAFATLTPSVPEFTLKLVGPPYVQNTTYSLDPNAGQIVATVGYTNQYSSLEIEVRNQPFDSSGDNRMYYNVRVKYHNSTDGWVEVYHAWNYLPVQWNDSDYTNLGFSIEEQFPNNMTLPGAQIDVQVIAMLGYMGRVSTDFNGYGFVGKSSDWSNTQTISIPADTPLSSSPTPTTSPTQNPTSTTSQSDTPTGFDWQTIAIAVLVVVVAVLVVGMVALWRRTPTKQEAAS
jgi:hypothetical protein